MCFYIKAMRVLFLRKALTYRKNTKTHIILQKTLNLYTNFTKNSNSTDLFDTALQQQTTLPRDVQRQPRHRFKLRPTKFWVPPPPHPTSSSSVTCTSSCARLKPARSAQLRQANRIGRCRRRRKWNRGTPTAVTGAAGETTTRKGQSI